MNEVTKRLLLPAALLALLTLVGTIGYVFLEGWSVVDAVYMTVITITTVGFDEVHPLTPNGLVFTMALAMFGVGVAFYLFASLVSFVLEGDLAEVFGRRKMEKRIKKMQDHCIVCGYGRMGRVVSRELRAMGVPFVVIEKDRESLPESPGDTLFYQGDATDDEVLMAVGIERASKLISVISCDADNLYVVLSAKKLNPGLFVVARAEQDGSASKMLTAGADKAISTSTIGGTMIAHTAVKPTVVDFISIATTAGGIDLQMEEVEIEESSKLEGLTLDQSGIGKELGVIVVAVKKPNGRMEFNPSSKTVLTNGDVLIALGDVARLKVLEAYALGA